MTETDRKIELNGQRYKAPKQSHSGVRVYTPGKGWHDMYGNAETCESMLPAAAQPKQIGFGATQRSQPKPRGLQKSHYERTTERYNQELDHYLAGVEYGTKRPNAKGDGALDTPLLYAIVAEKFVLSDEVAEELMKQLDEMARRKRRKLTNLAKQMQKHDKNCTCYACCSIQLLVDDVCDIVYRYRIDSISH